MTNKLYLNEGISDVISGVSNVANKFLNKYGRDGDFFYDGKKAIPKEDVRKVIIGSDIISLSLNELNDDMDESEIDILMSKLDNEDNFSFNQCPNLQTVVFKKGVKKIGDYAFANCKNLIEVQFGNVEYIGDYAFEGCTQLKDVILPDSINTIGQYAFLNCDNLLKVVIGKGIRNIKKYAFAGCWNLTKIILPNSKNKINIEDYAFASCGIKSINLPYGVEYISKCAFSDCYDLKEIIAENVKNMSAMCIWGCDSLRDIYIKTNGEVEISPTVFGFSISGFRPSENVTIHTDNEYVQEFANKNGIKCKSINGNNISEHYHKNIKEWYGSPYYQYTDDPLADAAAHNAWYGEGEEDECEYNVNDVKKDIKSWISDFNYGYYKYTDNQNVICLDDEAYFDKYFDVDYDNGNYTSFCVYIGLDGEEDLYEPCKHEYDIDYNISDGEVKENRDYEKLVKNVEEYIRLKYGDDLK